MKQPENIFCGQSMVHVDDPLVFLNININPTTKFTHTLNMSQQTICIGDHFYLSKNVKNMCSKPKKSRDAKELQTLIYKCPWTLCVLEDVNGCQTKGTSQ